MTSSRPVVVNGRSYKRPMTPTVVICIDGSEPGYVEQAIEAGAAPNFARFMKTGANLVAECVIPSFTNPNNVSIITGRPPAVHGIAGNFFYDPGTGTEVMMNDPKFMRAPTILAGFHDAGCKVAIVTAKDKLRLLLANGLDFASGRAIAFSSEHADKATKAENGTSSRPAGQRSTNLQAAHRCARDQAGERARPSRWTRASRRKRLLVCLVVDGGR